MPKRTTNRSPEGEAEANAMIAGMAAALGLGFFLGAALAGYNWSQRCKVNEFAAPPPLLRAAQ